MKDLNLSLTIFTGFCFVFGTLTNDIAYRLVIAMAGIVTLTWLSSRKSKEVKNGNNKNNH